MTSLSRDTSVQSSLRWDLAVTLTLRELTVRYKRSALGLAWALVEPLINVGVYVVVFGGFLGAASQTENYGLHTLAGLLPWMFFSSTLEQSAGTLLEHAPIVRKIAFPRELLIVAVVVSRLTTLAAGLVLAMGVTWAAASGGATVAWERLVWLPLGIACVTGMTLGLSLVLACLQVLLRDVVFLVRFGLRLGFYTCPIVYSFSRVPEAFRDWYSINPLVGAVWMVQSFTTPEGVSPAGWALVWTVVASVLAAACGVAAFHRLMPVVADRV